ncbi:hypothetical protein ACIA5E_25355 [Nocardia asteroides]
MTEPERSYLEGVNEFADWTDEEKVSILLPEDELEPEDKRK